MSRTIINNGSAANDGTGTELRTIFSQLNSMTSELYEQRNKAIDLNAHFIGDNDDLYSHESQILITNIGGKLFLLMIYVSNKISDDEWQLTAHSILKVFDLQSKALIQSFDLFYPGLTAGITMPADEEINAPRIYVSGTTLYCYCCNKSTLFKRTIDISDDDPTGWTPSNIAIAQMTMKDSGGSDVTVDVTSANIQTHLEYVLGDTYAGYEDLMPMFRNLDFIPKSGNNWYGTLECSGERSHKLAGPTICVASPDAGVSWAFKGLIGYTTGSRAQRIESTLVLVGTTLHLFDRKSFHYISTDAGVTWTVGSPFPFTVNDAKPSAVSFTPKGGSLTVFYAITLPSEIPGNTGRTTLAIYKTTDMLSFTEVAKIVTPTYAHYPCLHEYGYQLFISYTKGIKANTDPIDRDSIVFTKIE